MDIIDDFRSELTEGEIRFRDNLQFELKSEFLINPTYKKNIYKQEFFIFIPSTLQVNQATYSKTQFYLDQTNLIRYKTPKISLKKLIQSENLKSPLIRLQQIIEAHEKDEYRILDELRLFGNIFRVALRDQIYLIIKSLNTSKKASKDSYSDYQKQIEELCFDIKEVWSFYLKLQSQYFDFSSSEFIKLYFSYTDEFICDGIDYYLTCLLKIIRDLHDPNSQASEKLLCQVILLQQDRRETGKFNSSRKQSDYSAENILYRNSLLNKFMLEALLLNSNRLSLEEKHGDISGSLAAGIAMLVYMTLFVWKSPDFVINSAPFVLLAVFFYILKDRLKEGLKKLYYRQAFRWFPDYSTEIKDREGHIIGKLNENFLFIKENKVPAEVLNIRNKDFHDELPALKRLETIMHYKREVILYKNLAMIGKRRREITTIFRFNIHRFLEKASNALQPNIILEKNSLEIIERLLPKVYHINIIIINSYLKSNTETTTEIKKFRVIVDKFGIKRVEQINNH